LTHRGILITGYDEITASGTGKLLKRRWPGPGLKLNFNG
jgi:hypothetical protein